LHYGGWPRNALSEVALPNNIEAGIGEVRLLLPALANLLKQHYAIWIAPPFLPYAPALMEAKLNTNRLIIIDSNNLQDSLWSAEQAIKSGSSPAVLRMSLQPHSHSKLNINIIKQPGGWAGQSVDLSLTPHYENWQRLPSNLLPTYTQNSLPNLKSNLDLPSGITKDKNTSAQIANFKLSTKTHSA